MIWQSIRLSQQIFKQDMNKYQYFFFQTREILVFGNGGIYIWQIYETIISEWIIHHFPWRFWMPPVKFDISCLDVKSIRKAVCMLKEIGFIYNIPLDTRGGIERKEKFWQFFSRIIHFFRKNLDFPEFVEIMFNFFGVSKEF